MKALTVTRKELPIWIIVLAPIVYMITNLNSLPAEFPIHWNVYGKIDNYGSPWLFPSFQIGLYFLLLLTPLWGKAAKNYEKFKNTYYIFRVVFHTFFSIVLVVVIFAAKGYELNFEKIIVPLLVCMFMIFGNYFPKLKQNWFIGMRTPATLSNEEVWKKTHLIAGRVWFWGSLLFLPVVFWLEHISLFVCFMLYVAFIIAVPMIYAHKATKKLKQA